mmetsp:Transcript_5852/g.22971  ORF Transcript_5852/g.22971 Transcript_5852/m.22971 type:complete len:729 (-) Transcript_5852:815-3001(-)
MRRRKDSVDAYALTWSARHRAFDGGAVQAPAQMVRAASGQVHHGAVVPEHHVAVAPGVAVLEFGPGAALEQLVQQRTALVVGQADDAGREVLADEQGQAAGFGVLAHDRVHAGLDLGDLLVAQLGAPRAAGAQFLVLGEVGMFGLQVADAGLQGLGQGLPGGVLVGEQRVAPLGRQFLRQQHRPQAGLLHVGQVGVPVMARVTEADRLAVLDDVGHDQQLRVAGQRELVQHMDLQRPEAAAEVDLLLRRDALVAEHQHMVVEMGAVNTAEVVVGQRLAEVQPQHLGGEAAGEGADRDGGGPRGCVAVAGLTDGGTHGSLMRKAREASICPCDRQLTVSTALTRRSDGAVSGPAPQRPGQHQAGGAAGGEQPARQGGGHDARQQRADGAAKCDHGAPAHQHAAQQVAPDLRGRRPAGAEVARKQCGCPGAGHQTQHEHAVVGPQTVLDRGGTTAQHVQPLQARRQQAGGGGPGTRPAAQVGRHPQRCHPQVGDRRERPDQHAANMGRPAPLPPGLRGGRLRGRPMQPGQDQGQQGQNAQLQGERPAVAELLRQPWGGGLLQGLQIERVPAQEAQRKAQQCTGQRDRCGQRALAEPVPERADAGAGEAHAEAEADAAGHQHPAHRTDVGTRWQPCGFGRRQKGAEHRVVAQGADGQRGEDAEQAARIPALQEVAAHAVEAEPRPLQQRAKQQAQQQRQHGDQREPRAQAPMLGELKKIHGSKVQAAAGMP